MLFDLSLGKILEQQIPRWTKIYTIRGMQVMLDSDLAEIYGYETKNFNRQVKNNIEKFPEDMMFQVTSEEYETILRCKNFTSSLKFQFGTSNNIGGLKNDNTACFPDKRSICQSRS